MATFEGAGFVIEELFLGTGGKIAPPPFYEVAEAVAPGAGTQDRLGAQFGVDLGFPGDLEVLASGDLRRTRELEGIRANFTRALITSPGELFWRPDYGIGISEFLGRPATAQLLFELRNRIRSSLAADARIESIDLLDVVSLGDGTIEVDVRVTIAGTTQRFGLRARRT